MPEHEPSPSREDQGLKEESLILAKEKQWQEQGYTKDQIQELKAKLERFLEIKARLEEFLKKIDNLSKEEEKEIRALSKEKEKINKWRESFHPKEKETSFLIPQAINPYREALLLGGISDTDPLTSEKREISFDLGQILEEDIVSYKINLESFALALERIKGDLRLTPEKRQIIENEIKEGAIPIFMPGKDTQRDATPEMYKGIKPVWIKEGKEQTVNDTLLWDHLESLVSSKDPSLIQDLGDRPYLLLIKPTQRPEERTMNKTVEGQKKELAKMNEERQRKGKPPLFSLNPLEYGVLQQRYSQRAKALAPTPLTILDPLDKDTFTRFIPLPFSSGGFVPGGAWNPGGRRMRFAGGGVARSHPRSGFRSAVRVEL